MTGKARLDAVREKLVVQGRVSVSELSHEFSVTEETIRRDLEKLENEGFLRRTYGGAIIAQSKPVNGAHYYERARRNGDAKRKIAQTALPLLDGITTIAADSSSTVMELIRLIKDRDRLTILTNSTCVFLETFGSNAVVMSTGGTFDDETLSLTGETAQRALGWFQVDTVVFSCAALSRTGVLDSREADAAVKKAMLEQASRRILLADYSKFDKAAFVRLIGFDRIDYLVTDQEPSEEWKQILLEHGVELLY